MNSWFNLKRDEGARDATVRIFDQIGDSWWGDSVTAKGFTDAVDALGDDIETLNVHINSPGGNVYDGLAIYNYLKRHSAQVVVYIDGIAASIASIIAMAGDKIVMPENAHMFIHNPWTFAGGNAEALRKTADELDTIRDSLVGIYMNRSNLERDDIVAMMDDETLLTAEEAVAWGFATEMEAASQMAASVAPQEVMAMARLEAEFEARSAALNARIQDLSNRSEVLRTQNEELLRVIEGLRSSMEQMEPIAPAMLAEDVVTKVEEAGAPAWLSTFCIKGGLSEAAVAARITEYSDLRDVLVAAGMENPDQVCQEHFGNTTALISALLVEVLASTEEGTSNRLGVQGSASPAPQIDYQRAYASRRPNTH